VVMLQRLMGHGDDCLGLPHFSVFYCPADVSEPKVVVSSCYCQHWSTQNNQTAGECGEMCWREVCKVVGAWDFILGQWFCTCGERTHWGWKARQLFIYLFYLF